MTIKEAPPPKVLLVYKDGWFHGFRMVEAEVYVGWRTHLQNAVYPAKVRYGGDEKIYNNVDEVFNHIQARFIKTEDAVLIRSLIGGSMGAFPTREMFTVMEFADADS